MMITNDDVESAHENNDIDHRNDHSNAAHSINME